MLITLLRMGLPKNTILEDFCTSEGYENLNFTLITLQDLSNLDQFHGNHDIDKTKSDIENVCDLMERTEF
jgi:hypothetical protein